MERSVESNRGHEDTSYNEEAQKFSILKALYEEYRTAHADMERAFVRLHAAKRKFDNAWDAVPDASSTSAAWFQKWTHVLSHDA